MECERPGNKSYRYSTFYTLEDVLFCAGPHDGRRGPPTPGVHDFPRVFPERNIRNNFGGRYNVFDETAPREFRTVRILNNVFNQTQRSQNFTLPIYMDDVLEGVEELNLTLSLQPGIPSSLVNVTPAVATVRIHDSSIVMVGFSEDDYMADEGEPTLGRPYTPCRVTVEVFNGTLELPLPIQLTPRAGTATVADFNDTVIETEIPGGHTLVLQEIQIFDDDVNEASEVFDVLLNVLSEQRSNVMFRTQRTTCRIRQSDPIEIGFTRQRITRLEQFATQFDEMITKSRVSEQTFQLQIEISTVISGSGLQRATQDEDFAISLPNTTLMYNQLFPSDSNLQFGYQIFQDNRPENTEVFQVSVTPDPRNASNPSFDCNSDNGCYRQIEIRIEDDDVAVVGFVETLVDVNETDGQATLNIAVSAPPDRIEITFSLTVECMVGSAGPHDGRRGPPTPGVHDFPRVFPERNIRNNFGGRYNVFDETAPREFRTIRIVNNVFNQTQRSQNFTLPIYMDDVPEGVEELNLTLSLQSGIPSSLVNVTPAVATVRIHDFSTVVVGFESHLYTVGEQDGLLELCVNVTVPRQQDIGTVTFNLTVETQDGSAVSNNDYTSVSMTVGTFTSQRPRQCFSISITNDAITERTEDFTARLTLIPASVTTINASRIIVDPPETTVQITYNDLMIMVGYKWTNVNVFEADRQAELIVSINASAQLALFASSFFLLVNTQDKTATAPGDYGNLTNFHLGPFNNSVRQLSFNVSIVNDDIPEDAEMFNVSLRLDPPSDQASVGNCACDVATVTIQDDEAITVGYVETAVTVLESDGVATLTVTISVPPEDVPIETLFFLLVNTLDVTATATDPGDYGALNNLCLGPFNNSVHQLSFNMAIVNDSIPEDEKMFNVSLTFDPADHTRLGNRVKLSPDVATITIQDDDEITVEYVHTTVTVFESDEVATLTVAISMPPEADPIQMSLFLLVNTHDQTATAPSDYGTLTNFRLGPFNNDVRQLSFNVSIVNDNIPEDDKMFSASLTLYPADRERIGNRVTLSPDIATVTIQDNDVIVVGYIETDVNVSESDGVAQLTVAISMPPSGVSIEAFFYLIMNTLNGTATAHGDYGNLTNFRLGPFNNSVRQLSFNVSIVNDNITEDAEMVSTTLYPADRERIGNHVTVSPNIATVTIQDDDVIVVGYNLTDVFIFEGSNMVQLTIATSKPRKSVPVETSYYLIVNTLDGTATAPGDYGALNNFRLGPFNNDVRQISFNVSIVNESIPEDAEMFSASLTLDPADQARLGNRFIVSPDVATITIQDNDEIVVGYVQTAVTVLESDGVAHLNVGISRPATDPMATYFYLLVNTSDKSTAETAPSDYGNLTDFRLGPFNNDVRQISFNVSIVNDSIPEDAEMFKASLTLDPADQARLGNRVRMLPDVATVTIQDDDVIVVGYNETNVTASESTGAAQLTVAISMPAREVSIETSFYLIVNTLNGTATAPSDFGNLTNFRLGPFNNSVRQLSFNVSIMNDNIPEDEETFSASLTLNPADQARLGNHMTVSPDVATFTIIEDNDRVTIGIEPPSNPNGTEGVDSSVEHCVTIALPDMTSPIERGGFFVCASTVDGTATAGQDYQAVSNMHVGPFGNDDRRQCFNVNILNDTQSENSEYFTINVQFCPGDQPERVDINPSSGNTTIIDDDDVVIGFERLSYSVDEGVGQLEVCVVVSVPHQSDQLNRTFHLSVSTTPGTAGNSDFIAINNQDVGPFSNTQRQQCFLVEITNDKFPENLENFFANLKTRPGEMLQQVTINATVAEVTINDNDPPCIKIFQLLLGEVNDCTNWRFHDTREKLADITSSIISAVNSRCQCSLTVNQISAANFFCTSDRQVVLYRAELSGRSDCAQVLSYIEQWVSGSQRSIVVQGSITEVYPSCPIEVDSLMAQTECVRPTTIGPVTESVEITAVGGAVGGGVGGAVGGVVLIGIIVLGAVVYVCMYKSKHRAVDVKSNEAYGAVSIQEIKSNEAYDICHQEQPNDNYQIVQPPIIPPPPPPSGNLSPSVVCQGDEDASYAIVSVEQEPFDESYEEVGPNEEHLYETVEVPQSPNEYDEPRFENVHANT